MTESMTYSYKRCLVRRINGREIRVDITGCYWCSENDNGAVCVSCVAKGDALLHKEDES